MVRKLLVVTAVVCALLVWMAGAALTSQSEHAGPTQPELRGTTQYAGPARQLGRHPGSPFHDGVSDGKYAGSQPQNSNNPNSVSQYDVACFQVS